MLVKNLRTIDINRIVNKFNVNIINSSTIEYPGEKQDEFIQYVYELFEMAKVLTSQMSYNPEQEDYDIEDMGVHIPELHGFEIAVACYAQTLSEIPPKIEIWTTKDYIYVDFIGVDTIKVEEKIEVPELDSKEG